MVPYYGFSVGMTEAILTKLSHFRYRIKKDAVLGSSEHVAFALWTR